MPDVEQAIRERAYLLWVEAGQPDGHADAHWIRAQHEILAASLGAVARLVDTKSAPAEKPRKAKAKKRRAA